MTTTLIVASLIFLVAIAMTMVGKGGGNFYVVILALAHIPMHQAAATGQFILCAASLSAMVIFQKHKVVDWRLAFAIGSLTALGALAGGYFAHFFSGLFLKLLFAIMLVLAGGVMLLPVTASSQHESSLKPHDEQVNPGEQPAPFPQGTTNRPDITPRQINFGLVLPITLLTGWAAGMVGVSGGSFLVPLMVLACRVPMRVAVGTAATLIAATALMGFVGHAAQGDYNSQALPLALVAIVGGIIGGKLALQTKPRNLKKLFAYTNWIAAVLMIINAFYSRG